MHQHTMWMVSMLRSYYFKLMKKMTLFLNLTWPLELYYNISLTTFSSTRHVNSPLLSVRQTGLSFEGVVMDPSTFLPWSFHEARLFRTSLMSWHHRSMCSAFRNPVSQGHTEMCLKPFRSWSCLTVILCPESKYGGQLVSSKTWSVDSCLGFVLITILSFVDILIKPFALQ